MTPICPGSSSSVNWPLTNNGNGAGSSMAFYGNIKNGKPSCVMSLSQMQAMYLLGRDLEWRGSELWDNTQGGPVSDPSSFQPLGWYVL